MIALQTTLCPDLPQVINNIDYQNKHALLQRIDDILASGKIDECYIDSAMTRWLEQRDSKSKPRAQDYIQYAKTSQWGFRAMLLKSLLGYSYRELSVQLAQCPLYRWFCRMEVFGPIKSPGKSSLQDWALRLPIESMQNIIDQITAQSLEPGNPLELKNRIELETVWMDTTCLKANIHHPVDWLLLRDGTRTLIKAIKLIRKHGLKHRMQNPESFLTSINHLCMAMTHQGRKKDSKKKRKTTFRKMKRLCKKVENHARRHRDMLEARWKQTDWTQGQAKEVIRRIDGILKQLPKAIQQANERIIGERQIDSKDKILSLYDNDVNVIVRGKAGAQTEFGNKLILSENSQGLILDWKLYKDGAPNDERLLEPSLDRMEERFGQEAIKCVVGDRGFDSAANEQVIASRSMINGLTSKNPVKMKVRTLSAFYVRIQKRRAQTEARVAILTNDFAGTPMRSKGFKRREVEMSWHILTHNLWVLARMEKSEQITQPILKAAAA